MGGGISSQGGSTCTAPTHLNNQSHECLGPTTPSPSHHSAAAGAGPVGAAVETIRISIDEVLQHNPLPNSWSISNGDGPYDIKISTKDCPEITHQIHASPSSSSPSSPTRCDSPTTSWRKYCERISKRTPQSQDLPRP